MGIPRLDVLDMTTLARLKDWVPLTKNSNETLLKRLISNYSQIFANEMDRYIVYKQRTEKFDVFQEEINLHMQGWPIGVDSSGDPLMTISNDIALDPTYTTFLNRPEDYRVSVTEDEWGTVKFNVLLLAGNHALQIVWTGGMATKTVIEGTDGVIVAPPPAGTLASASSTFITDLVRVGMTLTILPDTSNEESHILTAIQNETTLQFATTPVATGAGNAFRVEEAGFVGGYPDIERAMFDQISFHYKQKDKIDIASMNIGGQSGGQVNYIKMRPLDLLPEVRGILQKRRREIYP